MRNVFFVSSRVGGRATLAALAAALAGCSGSAPTAYQLMQQQQQLQAQAQQAEEAQQRKDAPTQPDMMLSLVREAQQQGRHFAALAYVDAYIQQFGVTEEVRPLQASALRMTGQTEAAASVYRSLLNGPAAAQGLQGLGLMAGAAGDFSTASDYLARASKLRPIDADLLSDLGYARLQNGDVAGARVPLGQAAELNPTNTKVVANLALLLLVDGSRERAEQVMARGQFTDEARIRMTQLAADLQARLAAQPRLGERAQDAAVPAMAQASASTVSSSAAASSSHASASLPAAASSTASAAAAASASSTTSASSPAPASPEAGQVVVLQDGRDPNAPASSASGAASAPSASAAVRQPASLDATSNRAVPTAMYPPLMELLGNTPLVR